jgi:uncharacterized alkaline shock family protein YloU
MDPRAQDKDKPGREEKPAERNARGARTEVVAPFAVNGDTEVRGTVRIAPAVLIELIELTVSDIPGVVELRQRRRRKPTESGEPIGKSYDDGKVRVSVAGDQIEADISIAVSVGTNISDLASRVQKQVGIAAGRMLGMTVKTVNIYIDDIVDPAT